MKALHPPKVKQDPTLPFTPDEVNAIVSACDRFRVKGVHGKSNRDRLRDGSSSPLLGPPHPRCGDAPARAPAERQAPSLYAEDRRARRAPFRVSAEAHVLATQAIRRFRENRQTVLWQRFRT